MNLFFVVVVCVCLSVRELSPFTSNQSLHKRIQRRINVKTFCGVFSETAAWIMQISTGLSTSCALSVRLRFVPGIISSRTRKIFQYQAYCWAKTWLMQHDRCTAKDVPHLEACLPRLQPFTEDCVYRWSSSTLLWHGTLLYSENFQSLPRVCTLVLSLCTCTQ